MWQMSKKGPYEAKAINVNDVIDVTIVTIGK
jgi:hypothetical protein